VQFIQNVAYRGSKLAAFLVSRNGGVLRVSGVSPLLWGKSAWWGLFIHCVRLSNPLVTSPLSMPIAGSPSHSGNATNTVSPGPYAVLLCARHHLKNTILIACLPRAVWTLNFSALSLKCDAPNFMGNRGYFDYEMWPWIDVGLGMGDLASGSVR